MLVVLDRSTKVKVAYWYYKTGLTQEKIAQKLNFSRQRVNKIISSLVSEGIVSIEIAGLESEHVVLESALERCYSLKQAIIADMGQGDHLLLSSLGKKAAEFLDEYITSDSKIGVSWGTTLSETIMHMRSCNKPSCTVTQLVGGIDAISNSIKPDEITRMLAAKLGCDYSCLYAPATMSNKQAREILLQDDIFKQAFDRILGCDIAIMGIGQLDNSATILTQGYLEQQSFKELKENNFVGDICFNHFKPDGSFEDTSYKNTAIGVDIPTLHTIPTVIAIAGGANKAKATLGALNTGCIDVLIIDSTLANRLKELDPKLY